MATPVRIPGPESVQGVGVARDPGHRRATGQDFGAGIGNAVADLGATAAAIGAKFYHERKAVEDDILEQRDELEASTLAQKAYLGMQGEAGVDPDNFHARVGETLNAGFAELDKKYANEGIRISDEARRRVQARRSGLLEQYTLRGVTDGHNARVVDLGRTVETNLAQVGTQLAQDGDIAAAETRATAALGSLSKLVDPAEMEKARQTTNANLGRSVVSYLNNLQDEAVGAATDQERNAFVVEGHALIDHAVSKGWIDPAAGANAKREWEQDYQIRVLKSIEDPQERRRMLGDAPATTSGSFVDKVVGVESGGRATAKNPRSSATGLGQFIESTWASFIRERHPDLMAQGADIQKFRNDPALSREAVQWYADKNASVLRNEGLPVTDGSLYLAHFAGPQGAKAVLSADPNASAESVLGSAVVNANPFLKGKTAGDVVAWADKKMGGTTVSMSAHGPETGGDSFFASMPADVRSELIAGARQDERTQQVAEVAAVKGAYQLAIETDELTDRNTIINDLVLPDDDKAQLLKALDTKLEETAQIRSDTATYVSGGALDLNPLDPEDKTRANKLHAALVKAVPPEQAAVVTGDFIERTGVVPQSVAADVRRGIESDDPAQAAASLTDAANIYARAPMAVNHMDGGADVRDAAAAFTHYTDDLGYSAEEAAQKIISLRSPEAKKTEAALKPAADKLVKDLTVAEITDLFDPSVIPGMGGDPDAGFTPALEEMMLGDYREIVRDKFYGPAHGDAAVAKKMAQEDMKALYGVTNINGSPTLMKYPPEKFYPPIDGGWDYLRQHAMADAHGAAVAAGIDLGDGVVTAEDAIKDIYLEYTPETADDIRAGRLPRYRFYYQTEQDGQGIWHEVFKDGQRQGFGFTAPQMRAMQTRDRGKSIAEQMLQREQNRAIAESIGQQQEALRRGEPATGAPDRDQLMRDMEQRDRDAEYMRRGRLPPKPGDYARSLQEAQEEIFTREDE